MAWSWKLLFRTDCIVESRSFDVIPATLEIHIRTPRFSGRNFKEDWELRHEKWTVVLISLFYQSSSKSCVKCWLRMCTFAIQFPVFTSVLFFFSLMITRLFLDCVFSISIDISISLFQSTFLARREWFVLKHVYNLSVTQNFNLLEKQIVKP